MLYGHADQSFYLRQLVRAVGAGHGALQRELKHLTEMGLIVRKVQGNQVLYCPNSRSPIFAEIKSLISKTVGIHDVVRWALASLGPDIQIAFVYGSVARQKERADSDLDLMVLGDAPWGPRMSLQSWLQNSWLVQHATSIEEIKNLSAISDRDLSASQLKQLPADWRCAIAYNAALQAAAATLAAAGYRAARNNHHYRLIQSLEFTEKVPETISIPAFLPPLNPAP
jgi:predicted nucleotidyltransferase